MYVGNGVATEFPLPDGGNVGQVLTRLVGGLLGWADAPKGDKGEPGATGPQGPSGAVAIINNSSLEPNKVWVKFNNGLILEFGYLHFYFNNQSLSSMTFTYPLDLNTVISMYLVPYTNHYRDVQFREFGYMATASVSNLGASRAAVNMQFNQNVTIQEPNSLMASFVLFGV